MKFKVPWPLISEKVSKHLPSLSVFYEDHNKKCPFTKFVSFSKCSFGEICSQP